MHLLTAFSLKNRALIALVTIVAAVFGVIGVGSLKQELMPSVQFPAIAVVTNYPGASPEVVNTDVSGPIETALRGVPQLESSTATSSTGSSMVMAQFTYGVDLAATEQKVERAVSRISQMLPETADTQVLSGSIDDFPVIQIAVTPADGDTPEQAAQVVKRIAISELSDLDGVRDAQLTGAREDRVTIRPNVASLTANGLTPQSITDALQQSGVLMAAGKVADGDRTLAVQAGGELSTAEDIAALPIPVSQEALAAYQAQLAETPSGEAPAGQDASQLTAAPVAVTIGDVAAVTTEPAPVQSISRVDGAPALTIAVTKTSAANTVDVSHAVQEKLDELKDQLGGAKLSVIFDQAPYVEQSIHTLTTEGMLGLLFAVLVILVFLMSVRATLVTAISIPTSVLLTFVGLNFADYTLNMLTLGALTISIGRVVDDSIVVIENIKRHLQSGGDRAATIVEAVREVAGAITASTITTVAVFLPMAFVDGMVGELFRPFAFTVTIALLASLFVSLTIVPVLAYWFLRSRRSKRRTTATTGAVAIPTAAATGEEPVTRLQRWYRPIIEWTLLRPLVTLGIAVVVFGGTLAAAPLMNTTYLGSDEQNSVGLVQTLEPGTSLDAQLAQAEKVEKALSKISEIESVQVTIGSAGGGMSAIFGGGGDGTVNYSITTDPNADQAELQDRIRAAAEQLDDAGEFSIGQSGGGVTASSAIEVNVSAPDQKTLAKASDAVLAALKKQDGLQQVESDLAQSRPYLRIAVDRARAAQAGLSEAAVSGQVSQQMQPARIGQLQMETNTLDIYLATGTAPADQAGVAALTIQTASGPQRLDALASVEVADGPVNVRTEDGARMVTVSALPKGADLTAAGQAVNTALEQVKLPAGASANVGGVMSQQAEAFQQLGIALLAAILIVYVVMVATFRSLLQPLLLLVSVPFAATGAILLQIVTGIPLGVASLIGVLMLVGIVVTNAIVLIDLVNQYRSRGDALRDAVLHGSLQRLRPIVMTALATILALTPMALGITGQGGFISQPLAVVVIGGLLSSTVLTLVVLPTLYFLVERFRERRGGDGPRRRGGRVPADDGSDGAARSKGIFGNSGASSPAVVPEAAGAEGAFGPVRTGAVGAGAVGAAGAAELFATPDEARAPGPIPASAPAPVSSAVPDPVPAPDPDPVPVPDPVSVSDPVSVPVPVSASSSVSALDAALEDAGAEAGERPEMTPESVPAAPGDEPAPEPDSDPDSLPDLLPREEVPLVLPASLLSGSSEAEAQSEEPATADPETQQAILSALFKAGLAAPEVSRRRGTMEHAVMGEDPQADIAAVTETAETADTADTADTVETDEMGPATAQMSLALTDLGFTGDQDPLRDEAPEAEAQADVGTAAGVAADPGAGAEAEAEAEAEAGGPVAATETDLPEEQAFAETDREDAAPEVAAEPSDEVGAPDPESADTAPIAAPPLTGELNWEQLMWQATQDIDGTDSAADSAEER